MTQIGRLALALSRILVAADTPRRSFPLPLLPPAQSTAPWWPLTANPQRRQRRGRMIYKSRRNLYGCRSIRQTSIQGYVSGQHQQEKPDDHRLMPSPGFNLEVPFG
jgi:hypothetical protein